VTPVLLDRHNECASIDRLVAAVRAGRSRALVLRGEPGVGKTVLLDYVAARSQGCRVERASGVQSELELAFAGLHQLCAPMLDRLGRLPGPQRDALRTTFGMSGGQTPDPFLVGLAVLGLFAEIAEERPLVCVVDDAQWLDHASAQVLAFVARRLEAESVALIFAARGIDEVAELSGLPQLVLGGLSDEAARTLLRSALCEPMDDRVLNRVVAETRGNPLALLELPRGLTPAQLSGGFGPDAGALPQQIEDSYRRRLAPLPAETQQLLLVASAEPLGDPVLLWRAAERLGIGVEAVAPAVTAGLLEIGARVRFHHPLVRSTIYRAASAEQRRGAHHVLAEATDPEADPDRRAWHHAQATSGPDEDVAAELDRSAERAQARGGLAAAAAFLERAIELTPEPARRAERALAAAHARHHAGASDAALKLLSITEAGPLDKLSRARADVLRAQIAFAVNIGGDAASLLLRAAKQLEPLNLNLARETYLHAFSAAIFAGSLSASDGAREVAEAVRAAPRPARPGPPDLLLDGLAVRFTDGYRAATPMLRRALSAFRGFDHTHQQGIHASYLTCVPAVDMWDEETWEALLGRHVQLTRDTGALSALPFALNGQITVCTFAGELTEAASLLTELETIVEATGRRAAPYGALALAAWRGRETEAAELIEATLEDVVRRREGLGLTFASWAQAVLYNGLGRYADALTSAERASERTRETGAPPWGLSELIEAATRGGDAERAADAFRTLASMTSASGTDWALGIEARSRALLGTGQPAESAYREAIDRLGRTRIRAELARAHLLYGEWLRRERRRVDAREQLRIAHAMFTSMGAEAFTQRAARELRATGEITRKRSLETDSELTSQEAHIARLVREGLSNPEIAARLFISPRTVEWHLGKIFDKLGITSRKQLYR